MTVDCKLGFTMMLFISIICTFKNGLVVIIFNCKLLHNINQARHFLLKMCGNDSGCRILP